MNDWSDEETDEPLIADHRNFYKVEKWSRDGQRGVWSPLPNSSLAGQEHDRTTPLADVGTAMDTLPGEP